MSKLRPIAGLGYFVLTLRDGCASGWDPMLLDVLTGVSLLLSELWPPSEDAFLLVEWTENVWWWRDWESCCAMGTDCSLPKLVSLLLEVEAERPSAWWFTVDVRMELTLKVECMSSKSEETRLLISFIASLSLSGRLSASMSLRYSWMYSFGLAITQNMKDFEKLYRSSARNTVRFIANVILRSSLR